MESLIANLLVTLLASRLTRATEEEHRHAYRTMVDSLPVPQRTSLAMTSANDVEAKLAYKIGKEAADLLVRVGVTHGARDIHARLLGLQVWTHERRRLIVKIVDKLDTGREIPNVPR